MRSGFRGFRLRMEADVTDLLLEKDRVIGVTARTPSGPLEVRAKLVIGADGRSSIVRARGGLEVIDLGARSTSFGFVSPRNQAIPRKPSDLSASASSWS